MRTLSILLSIGGALAITGLAVGLAAERRACIKLDLGNKSLRQQLLQLDVVVAENQRLSNLVAQASGSAPRPSELLEPASATDAEVNELARLREKVTALRQQYHEIEALRADTRQIRAAAEDALKQKPGQAAKPSSATGSDASQLEILSAQYWTPNTNMDVAAELRERIRNDRLKAIASNHIKGDPEYGQSKRLTIVYRFGGSIRTNEFREGDPVILPTEE